MRTSPLAKIVLTTVCISVSEKANAQFTVSYDGKVPTYRNANTNTGFGITVFSPALNNIHGDKKDILEFRLGLEGYGSKYNSHTVWGVPLLQLPGIKSEVSLKNNLWGGNLVARFSFPYRNDVIPYFDLTLGTRSITTAMRVKPDSVYTPSKEKIFKAHGNTYGAGIGAMINLGERWKLNLGFSFTNSDSKTNVLAIKDAHVEANSLVLQKRGMPYGMVHFNAGLVVNVDENFMIWIPGIFALIGEASCNLFDGCDPVGCLFSGSDSDEKSSNDNSNNPPKKEPEKGKVNVIIE